MRPTFAYPALLLALVLIAPVGCSFSEEGGGNANIDGGGGGGGGGGGIDAGGSGGQVDAGGGGQVDAATGTPSQPGSACSCDADCAAVEGHAGICVFGVCMTRASATCSAGGSTAECGAGSRCWGLQGEEGSICWPDCASYTCGGTCDGDGSCAPASGGECGYTCGSYCSCTPADCTGGTSCVNGECVQVAGGGPGPGPGPDCANLPPRDCTGTASYCGELIAFNPRVTPHYDDYPINGETTANQYRSYLRRDLAMLLDHATAKVLCKASGWTGGIGGALGFGDMSESNGAIPGTAVGSPGHPQGTHTNGFDIDLAYYQHSVSNNYLRAVCEHTINNQDQYHCTAQPDILDVWRTALFLGYIFESPRTRVIGVDGQVGPLVQSAMAELCATGWLAGTPCNNPALAFETTNMGYGWYQFHHHHAHISLKSVSASADPVAMPCMSPGCEGSPLKLHPVRPVYFSPH